MAVHLGRRTADASAARVADLPDDLAGRGCPETFRALVRGCPRWASVGVSELRAVLQARRRPDALPKAAFQFLDRAAAAVLRVVVVVVRDAPLREQRRSVRQVRPGE